MGRQMHESAMTFDGFPLTPQKEVVRAFYKDMWDHADKSLISKLFHEGFTFRGSLGPELVGYEQFGGCVDWVTSAFGQYTADILAIIEEGNRVSGKMRFHGYHRQELFGVVPTGDAHSVAHIQKHQGDAYYSQTEAARGCTHRNHHRVAAHFDRSLYRRGTRGAELSRALHHKDDEIPCPGNS